MVRSLLGPVVKVFPKIHPPHDGIHILSAALWHGFELSGKTHQPEKRQ